MSDNKNIDLAEVVRFAIDHAPDIAELLRLAGGDPEAAIAEIRKSNIAARARIDAALIDKYDGDPK